MQTYKSHKQVQAFKVEQILKITRIDGLDSAGDPLVSDKYELHGAGVIVEVSQEYMAKHKPQLRGYYMLYADGYESFSPADAFEDGYTAVPAEPKQWGESPGGPDDTAQTVLQALVDAEGHPTLAMGEVERDVLMARAFGRARTLLHRLKKNGDAEQRMPEGAAGPSTARQMLQELVDSMGEDAMGDCRRPSAKSVDVFRRAEALLAENGG